jgi:hypothetical protein
VPGGCKPALTNGATNTVSSDLDDEEEADSDISSELDNDMEHSALLETADEEDSTDVSAGGASESASPAPKAPLLDLSAVRAAKGQGHAAGVQDIEAY